METVFIWVRAQPIVSAAVAGLVAFAAGWAFAPETPAAAARDPFAWRDPAALTPTLTADYGARPLLRRGPAVSTRESAAERRARLRAERDAREALEWRYGGQIRSGEDDWRVVVLRPGTDKPIYLNAGDTLPDGSRIDSIDGRGVWVTTPDDGRTRYGNPEQP